MRIAQHIDVNFFLFNEVHKIKPPRNPEKWTLGRINSHSLNNILSRFLGTRNEKKLNTDNYCTSFNVKLAFFTVFVLALQIGFAARWCFRFSANESSIEQVCPPWFKLCVKKHEWRRSTAANKAHFLQPTLLLRCAEPPDHLRSEITSRALATFQNIGKARKQEAIWIKCVVCSYFHKILH